MTGKFLMTGAAGTVAGYLRPSLGEHYSLRFSDRVEPQNLRAEEEFRVADLADAETENCLMKGVDGIVHLGGVSREDAWETIRSANIDGTYNVLEAAREHGVERVVLASSNHSLGFYPRTQRIGVEERVRPDSVYGVSKAFAEALGSLYADKYGLRVMSIRIGNLAERPIDTRRLSIWISPRDLTQLIRIGLEHPRIRNEIVDCASDNLRAWWDNSTAQASGYRPEDRSEDCAEEVLAAGDSRSASPLSESPQGGDFALIEAGASLSGGSQR